MNEVKFVCFKNVALGAKEGDFLEAVLRIFKEECAEPSKAGVLKLQLFEEKQGMRRGVLSGICADFDAMKKKSLGKKILGRDIVIVQDKGDPRDKYGDFLQKDTPGVKRHNWHLKGYRSHRVSFTLFKSDFEKKIQSYVGGSDYKFRVNVIPRSSDLFNIPGRVVYCGSRQNSTLLRYATAFEAYQSIRYLSKRPIDGVNCSVTDEDNKNESQLDDQCGLGVDGKIINLRDGREYSDIILFDEIDMSIRRDELIYPSLCWRCKKSYKLVGFHTNLTELIGICGCIYDCELDIMDKNRAYFYPQEKFTRLLGQHSVNQQAQELIIDHYPMKPVFNNATEFLNICAPILQEEWKFFSKVFKESNSCSATLVDYEFIEQTEKRKGHSLTDVYAMKLTMDRSKTWTEENLSGIKHVTLTFVNDETNTTFECRGYVSKLTAEDKVSKNVFALLQAEFPLNVVPKSSQQVKVIPKPDKSEYNNTKHIIRQLAEKKDCRNFLHDLFLNPETKDFAKLFRFPDKFLNRRAVGNIYVKLRRLRNSLNVEQKLALDRAIENMASTIQGPPGCGKTHVTCTILAYLSTLEHGKCVATASSNVACDGIAHKLTQVLEKYHLPVKAIRIYAPSKETLHILPEHSVLNADQIPVLHEAVIRHPQWLTELPEIRKILEDKGFNNLTNLQRKQLKSHRRDIERIVLQDFGIFIITVGCLGAKRLQNWTLKSSVSTIVLDEAGQLTLPQTLSIFALQPYRFVFVGDHLQLRPTIHSLSATLAGLSKSMMEWIAMTNNAGNLPWTRLAEQHRMVPKIRELVSNFTYDGKLRDSLSITKRTTIITDRLLDAFPELQKSPIIIFDHELGEQREKVSGSYRNIGESRLIVKTVQMLRDAGIHADDVTILTLYEYQRAQIRDMLRTQIPDYALNQIYNVDGFQGREQKIILLSFVRSNQKGDLGFAKEANRINVALSRAMHLMFIFCNMKMFKIEESRYQSQIIRRLKSNLEELSVIKKII